MRIERLELDGFGRFHEASWQLGEGLTVLVGANEAGKTTLLNGLRALLFGFEPSRDGRTWYPALHGGRRGGRLVLLTARGERWTVERHGERGGTGALAVRAPNGNQGGQETLDRLLHGADRDLFNNIFAFGLGELQTFASLSADGVRGRIYGAGAGLGGSSALDIERRLRQQLDALFLPRGSQKPLNAALGRIEALRRDVAELSRQPEEHAAAQRERRELLARADRLRADSRELRERLARLQQLRRAGPIAAELALVEEELAAGDASLDALPEDAVAALDRRLGELAEARAVLATIEEQLEKARRASRDLVVDEQILAVASELDAVLEERARRAAAEERRADLRAAEGRHAAAVAEQVARSGLAGEERLLALDDAIPQVEATRDLERRLLAAREAVIDADRALRAAVEELQARERETGVAAPHDDADLDRASTALDELDRARARSGPAAGASDVRTRGAVAVALAVAAALVGVWLDLLAPLLAVGLVAAAAVLATAVRRPTTEGRSEAEVAALERLGLPPDATDAAVRARAEEIARLRARREVATEQRAGLEGRRIEVDRRTRALEAARGAATEVAREWVAWLGDRGLPESLSPEAARQVLAAAGAARRAARERDHHREAVATLEREQAEYEARVIGLLDRLEPDGTPPTGYSTDARLLRARDRLVTAREARRRAGELATALEELEERRRPAVGAVAEREAAVEAHLAAVGCPDEETLRRRSDEASRRRASQASARELRARLAGVAGAPDAVGRLVEEARASDPAALEAAEIEARTELERLEVEEREIAARIGGLDGEIRRLETSAEVGARRQELAALEGQARATARSWAARAVALALLEATRARYERERQPDVVRAAESHFERITGGRYTRIVAPPGEGSVRVETDGGESRVTDELSRGTGEQLYLALRFGLIEEFARHAEPLPVVMDDILVNFDAERAGRAAAAIRELSARHQVLYFTCHRWTAELLDPDGARTLTLG